MPQTLTSVGIRVYSLVISLAQDNTIQELRANADVNYGTWGRGEQVDMLSDLTVAERSSLDALVTRLTRKLQQDYETPQ